MELKKYQRRVLSNLRDYARLCSLKNSGPEAYARYLSDNNLQVGEGQTRAYIDELDGIPKVCIKVPTGGGKTFIAAHSIGILVDQLPPESCNAVVWLVPRDEILRQTLRQLSNPANPLRAVLDRDFSHRVEVLDKEDALMGRGLNVTAVQDQLTVLVLSCESFKNKEGRRAYRENSRLSPLTRYQRSTGTAVDVAGADDTALMSALAGLHPLVIVDESHHAKSDLSLDMLRNFNPRFVLELTATPTDRSNVISRATAIELKREQMVKLPVIVYRRDNKREVVEDSVLLQRRLEQIAVREESKTGRYIRPIVLLQAQRRDDTDAESFDRLKGKLVKAGIPEEQIAIRTGDIDELRDIDLMDRGCPIRFVITVEALSEGWDCPFAYVLASVANKQSKTNVEQIVGRVLRQPYATRTGSSALNISYVLTSSAAFDETVGQVVAGLNGAGFSRKDVVVGKEDESSPVEYVPGTFEGLLPDVAEPREPDAAETDDVDYEELDGLRFAPVAVMDDRETEASQAGDDTSLESRINAMIRDSAEGEKVFDENAAGMDPALMAANPTGLEDDVPIYHVRDEVTETVRNLRLPRFYREQELGLFAEIGEADAIPLEYLSLLSDFRVDRCSTAGIHFDQFSLAESRVVDVNDDSQIRTHALDRNQSRLMHALTASESSESKRRTIVENMLYCVRDGLRELYGDKGLRRLFDDVLEDLDDEQLAAAASDIHSYTRVVMNEIERQAEQHRRREFNRLLSVGDIRLERKYRLPESITLTDPITTLDRTLYEAEESSGMNSLERRMAQALADCDNVVWWHRVRDRREGEFCINGWINHYPDFLAMVSSGTVLAVETKGEQLKNDDTAEKLDLGNLWASSSGGDCRYFMVFDHSPMAAGGSYMFNQFVSDLLPKVR